MMALVALELRVRALFYLLLPCSSSEEWMLASEPLSTKVHMDICRFTRHIDTNIQSYAQTHEHCTSYISIAMVNNLTKNSLGRKRLIFLDNVQFIFPDNAQSSMQGNWQEPGGRY